MTVSTPTPQSITNLSDLLSSLSALQTQESQIATSLAELLASREPIIASLARLKAVSPQLNELYLDATVLSEKVSTTAKTAERVGGRVKSLDEEMRRVREAGERVGQVMELKSSLAELQSAINSQDWESATRHCARAMSIPKEVITGPFAEAAVPSSESPLPPSQTLQVARENLLSIFRHHFQVASQSRDSAGTSRFFKLFPAISWEAEGLEEYSAFVVDLVRSRAPTSGKTSSPLYYITTLTSLFESIALIVDQHQPVVEKYYGQGKMLSVVGRLLDECDRVVNGLVIGWEEERSMKRKLLETANPTFTTFPPFRKPNQPHDDEQIDPREIDKVLSEAAGITGRWALFRRFLYERLKEDRGESATPSPSQTPPPEQEIPTGPEKGGTSQNDPPSAELQFIESCNCRKLLEKLLSEYYVPLETWYLRTIIDKAHRLSSTEPGVLPPITTTPDDVFYILKLVISRLISTGSRNNLEYTLAVVKDVMEREFAAVMKKKLDEIYRPSHGPPPNLRGEKVEKEARTTFIILLNDLDVSSLHMERLVKDLESSPVIHQNYLRDEATSARAVLSSMLVLVPTFRAILKAGIEQLFNQLVRPRLRLLIAEVYKDVSYALDEDSYTAAEYQDLVRKRFIRIWDSLTEGFKDTFTEPNYSAFFGLTLEVLVRPWEKIILSMRYTELGAIRFDRDLRAITSYLSSHTVFGDARDKLLRLQQISTLLNIDNEEDVDEFYSGSGITWRLSINEARNVAALRL